MHGRHTHINSLLVVLIATLSCTSLFYGLPPSPLSSSILWSIRLPRLCTVLGVATILSLSGYALQTLFRNDLAEPGILGISSGGTLGAVMAIFISSHFHISLPYYVTPLSSILFSFLSIALILKFAGKNAHSYLIVLIGIAINSFNGSLITLISYLSDISALRNIVFWGMGSFSSTNLPTSLVLVVTGAVLCALYHHHHHTFSVLALNEENLFYAGYKHKRIQYFIIVTVTISVGISVATCGLVAFIGLIAPHMARIVVGTQPHKTILTSVLMAMALVLATDLLSKNLLYPVELPSSVLTSFIGAPYFIHLIFKHKHSTLESK